MKITIREEERLKHYTLKLHSDLERSGIPLKHIKKLGFEVMTREDVSEYLYSGKAESSATAYKIPYFDHTGKPINFARLRLLDGKWRKSGFNKGKEKHRGNWKYNQKASSAPHLYIPPVFKWPLDKKTGKVKLSYLCVTEGEKKAIKACLCGIPTVAIGGVYNFKSAKRGVSLLEEFSLFDLTDGTLDISYDSDTESNEEVRAALNAFAAEAAALKPAHINFVILEGDSRTGLDDFLASFDTPAEAYEAFFSLTRRTDNRRSSIVEFDTLLRFVQAHNRFYNTDTGKFYGTRQQMYDAFESRAKVPDPTDPRKTTPAIKLWFEQRSTDTEIADIAYRPGHPPLIPSPFPLAPPLLNTWKPCTHLPKKGVPTLWLTLFDFLTSTLKPSEREWLLQWFAYPIQNPGAKLFSAVFIYSYQQGIGKNFLIEPFMERIYGSNYQRVDAARLDSDFNSWAARKQFLFLDEVYTSNRSSRNAVTSSLNSLITNSKLDVNEKFQPAVQLDNHANLYLSSNHSDGVTIPDKDRRMLVIHAPETKLEQAFYTEMHEWAHNGDGTALLHHYLLNDVDTAAFNPRGAAPRTESREIVVEHSSDNAAALVDELLKDPATLFQVDGTLPEQQLFTAAELLAALNAFARRVSAPPIQCSTKSIGRYLAARPFVSKRCVVKTPQGNVTTPTLYAIFNVREWSKRSDAEWRVHYKKHNPLFRDDMRNVIDLEIARKKRAKADSE